MNCLQSLVAVAVLAAGAAAQSPRKAEPPDPAPRERSADEARRVRVKAEGYSRDDALKQALRKALEQGAGVQISSYSRVENFALLRDTIYSRASGIVKEYRVLGESPGAGGVVAIEIEALVSPDAVASVWSEVQNVLDQIGRPRIMVWIDERIEGQLQDDSVVAARLEQMLVKSGFDLVERRAIEEIRRSQAAEAERTGDAARLAALARGAGAHLLVRGSANADRAGRENLYDQVPASFYTCDVQAKVYHADTGRLLASESLPATRAGLRTRSEFSPQAARAALVQATFPDHPVPGEPPPLGPRLYEAVMQQWATQVSSGGDLELEVEGLDFRGYVAVRDALQAIDAERLLSIHGDFSAGIARYRIRTTLSAETLAERLLEKPFSDWLEVLDLKLARIQARAVRRP